MRYSIGLATVLLSLIILRPPAIGWDGNEFLKVHQTLRAAYIAGAVDTYVGIKGTVEAARSKGSYSAGGLEQVIAESVGCIHEMPYAQVVAIVEKYMKDHPERWHYAMADSIFGALWETCKKKP
jgi:hypothetical protein